MRCPACKNKLLQKSGTSTRVRVEGALEFGDDDICRAKCFWCKAVVSIPISLQKADVDVETFILPPQKR